MIVNIGFVNNFVGSVFAACFMGMVMGNLNSWSSPVLPKLESNTTDNPFDKAITTYQGSLMSSLVTIGAVIGCWYGLSSDFIGRKIVFISLGVPVLIGYVLMLAVHKLEVFYVARFLQGLSVGAGFNIFIVYIGEISNKENRGVAMTTTGMMSSAGALFCYVVGPYVSVTLFNTLNMLFPIAFLALSIIFCEESPYYYLIKNNDDLARKALRIYRSPGYDFEEEMVEMKEQIKKQREGNIFDIIKTKGYLKAFIIANVLLIAQQFTGINAILMYTQTIFTTASSNLSPEICSIIVATIQLFSGGIAPFIANKFDKKHILITSGIGMAVCEVILGVYCIVSDSGKNVDSFNFIPILTLTGFMLSYNFGFGPGCWIVAGEVYPTRVKLLSISFSITVYFLIGFLIGQYFQPISDAIGMGPVFIIFAGCCVATCVFIKFYVIETRGISFEKIQDILNNRKSQK